MDKNNLFSVVVSVFVFVLLYSANGRFLTKVRKNSSPRIPIILISTFPWFLTGLLTPYLGWLITGIVVGMVLWWILTVFPI
jgi:hypothetical protein